MSEWKEYKLGELLTIKYGKNQKEVEDARGPFPIYGTGGLMGHATRPLYDKPSILIGRKGTIDKVRYVEHPFWTVDTLFYSEINEDLVIPKFLYYSMCTINFMNYNEGTTIPSLRTETLNRLTFKVPPLPEQRRIASILGSLDDKIELNNAINRNLEEQAQAIFKNWFIDFAPFGGKMPGEWKEGKLFDLGTVVGGGTPPKAKKEYYTENGIAWITPKDLSLRSNKFTSKGEIDITQEGYDNSSAKLMPKGSVLFSSRAPIGYISIAQNEVCTNQGFKSVVPKQNIGTPYVYFYLKIHIDEIENKASGSTFKEASGALMNGLDAIIPSDEVLDTFNAQCNPIFEQQENLEKENQRLTTLRDALLPKLMSDKSAKAAAV